MVKTLPYGHGLVVKNTFLDVEANSSSEFSDSAKDMYAFSDPGQWEDREDAFSVSDDEGSQRSEEGVDARSERWDSKCSLTSHDSSLGSTVLESLGAISIPSCTSASLSQGSSGGGLPFSIRRNSLDSALSAVSMETSGGLNGAEVEQPVDCRQEFAEDHVLDFNDDDDAVTERAILDLLRQNEALESENRRLRDSAAQSPAQQGTPAAAPAVVPPAALGQAAGVTLVTPQQLMLLLGGQAPAMTLPVPLAAAPALASATTLAPAAPSIGVPAATAAPVPQPSAASLATAAPAQGAEAVDVERRTTVMVQNLPSGYSQEMFLSVLDEEGFRGLYDFVYLPMDYGTGACFGYAFVNLVDSRVAPSFWAAFSGYAKWSVECTNVATVAWCCTHQGLTALIERYRDSPVMHESVPDDQKPAIFLAGARAAFPPPTRRPRAPRLSRAMRCARGASGSSQD